MGGVSIGQRVVIGTLPASTTALSSLVIVVDNVLIYTPAGILLPGDSVRDGGGIE